MDESGRWTTCSVKQRGLPMKKVTSHKVSNNRISPDWDVKRPNNDGKEGWEGFDEAKGL